MLTSPETILIFTDLDGTLLNAEDYRYDAALPILNRLQQAHIPIIPVTSKTFVEVEQLRDQIGLRDPFVVENGAGIVLELNDSRFSLQPPPLRKTGQLRSYGQISLGASYPQARAGLARISQRLGRVLVGFGDMTLEDLMARTGLSSVQAQQAQQRDFTEPFVTPKDLPAPRLVRAAQQEGFEVVVGDRFSHLIAPGSGKGEAVQILAEAYGRGQSLGHPPTTVGLGNSPNDQSLLEAVHQAIVIPGVQGPHPQLIHPDWTVAPQPGAAGWAQAVEDLIF
ncbi:HAD-IIB family hydrolase [Lyngbya confervoides]|uniref:HAD-IIB family hydrolase n=1 Tax=Lyngbya confervoides BDU141951 TaxID=1574623 RepID=A0ABD4T479_9CYAN|nr:HAD-IIB family hydrolase [Lyngbya confervoides]MCM1983522.1 HAD-IIB family hydrolase [Lyngbya confervoides BDU141951]